MKVSFVGKQFNEYQANGSMTVYDSDKLCCTKGCRSNASNQVVDQKCSSSKFHTFPFDNKFGYQDRARHGCVQMCSKDFNIPDHSWVNKSCLTKQNRV